MNLHNKYHIYEIPKIQKIGCTQDFDRRFKQHVWRLKKKGIDLKPQDMVLLESWSTMEAASMREEVLQNKRGYPTDVDSYKVTMRRQKYASKPEIRKKAGKSISKATKGRVNDMSYLNTKQAKENWRKSVDMDALKQRIKQTGFSNRKPIDVYFNGKLYKSYISCSVAAKDLPISLASITNCANPNHKTKQVLGYSARYSKK